MASSEYKLAVVNGTSLSLSLSGPAGPTGATGGVTSVAGRTGPVTLVSADITDATSSATPDTIVLRDSNGDFFGEACGFASVNAGSDVSSIVIGSEGVIFYINNTQSILQSSATAYRTHTLPDSTGTLPAVPPYASLALANAAALGAGTFFWDTTLKKLRVTTA